IRKFVLIRLPAGRQVFVDVLNLKPETFSIFAHSPNFRMDRNSIIGLLLIGALLIGFSLWNQPGKEQLEAMKRQQDSIALVEKANVEAAKKALKEQQLQQTTAVTDSSVLTDSAKAAALEQQLGAFASAATGINDFYVIENNLIRAKVAAKGGRIISLQLKKYKSFEGKPLILFEGDSSVFGLNFFSLNRNISTNNLYFTPVNTGSKKELSMRLNAGENKYIEYNYSLTDDSYLLNFTIKFNGINDLVATNTSFVDLDWQQTLLKQERDVTAERVHATIFYKYLNDEVDNISEGSDEQKDLNTKVKWVAFKQQFFSSVLISKDGFESSKIESLTAEPSPEYVKNFKASFRLPFSHKTEETIAMNFYFGPNHFQTLHKLDLDLEKIISLGFFGFVNRWLVIPVFNWLDSFNINYGIIILILTIMIRIILLPLTYRSFLSQAKMKVLQPEVNELNEKNKEDPMKKQQELMALYRRAGVNPLGGCIPGLLQVPILFAMFSFFPASIELRQQSFLWAKDLSTYDSIAQLPFNIPFYGDHVSLFTILMTLSTLAFTAINMQMTSAANPQMKWMMYLMPIMFLGVFNSYSAGLSYYYFLSNLCGLGQQYLFKAFVDQDAIHRKIQEKKLKPVTKSKFQQRLEQMAKQRGYQLPKK
ncbi:MAG TPA: membrane protein insertase YidC, partial [Bacteroidia bacterium]|nr:membrane protein insertase YidC [Bacteroidia bacterium]